jgi:hypothetical protein
VPFLACGAGTVFVGVTNVTTQAVTFHSARLEAIRIA